jgi:hypothetical protein
MFVNWSWHKSQRIRKNKNIGTSYCMKDRQGQRKSNEKHLKKQCKKKHRKYTNEHRNTENNHEIYVRQTLQNNGKIEELEDAWLSSMSDEDVCIEINDEMKCSSEYFEDERRQLV